MEVVVELVEGVVGSVFEHYVVVFPVPFAVGPELASGLVELGLVVLAVPDVPVVLAVLAVLVVLAVLAVLAELAELGAEPADELATELAAVRVVLVLELVVLVVGRGEHVVAVAPAVGRAGTSVLASWFSWPWWLMATAWSREHEEAHGCKSGEEGAPVVVGPQVHRPPSFSGLAFP